MGFGVLYMCLKGRIHTACKMMVLHKGYIILRRAPKYHDFGTEALFLKAESAKHVSELRVGAQRVEAGVPVELAEQYIALRPARWLRGKESGSQTCPPQGLSLSMLQNPRPSVEAHPAPRLGRFGRHAFGLPSSKYLFAYVRYSLVEPTCV